MYLLLHFLSVNSGNVSNKDVVERAVSLSFSLRNKDKRIVGDRTAFIIDKLNSRKTLRAETNCLLSFHNCIKDEREVPAEPVIGTTPSTQYSSSTQGQLAATLLLIADRDTHSTLLRNVNTLLKE